MTQDEIDEIKYGPKSSEHDDPNESGWTAEGALRFYAAGKNYDIVGDRVRILDNGAVASDALKGMSPEYAATKGCSEKHSEGATPRTDALRKRAYSHAPRIHWEAEANAAWEELARVERELAEAKEDAEHGYHDGFTAARQQYEAPPSARAEHCQGCGQPLTQVCTRCIGGRC